MLFISSFLPWVKVGSFSESGLSTDFAPGLLGIWCLLIGGAIAVLVALSTFGNVNLPDRVLGFSWNQIFLMLGFAAFLITFGEQFRENAGIGILLGWIASAVIVAGAFMELQGESKSSGGGMPPTTF